MHYKNENKMFLLEYYSIMKFFIRFHFCEIFATTLDVIPMYFIFNRHLLQQSKENFIL